MNVLLTNDDGVFAPGIKKLYESLKHECDLYVVAPDSEQSATGHGITLTAPLRVVGENIYCDGGKAFAVNGTPVDCVKLAVKNLLDLKIDLVVSGINLGENTGCNLIYSGTVSAAIEGYILGIPAIAVSLTTYVNPDFSYAAELIAKIVKLYKNKEIDLSGMLLNINVPSVPKKEIKGILLTTQGKTPFVEEFKQRTDPSGRSYFWLAGKKLNIEDNVKTDEGAILNNYVSITPLQYDMTDYSCFEYGKDNPVNEKAERLSGLLDKIMPVD